MGGGLALPINGQIRRIKPAGRLTKSLAQASEGGQCIRYAAMRQGRAEKTDQHKPVSRQTGESVATPSHPKAGPREGTCRCKNQNS